MINQAMIFRENVIKYSFKYGVTKAAIRYKLNRQYIYRWRKRYDGTIQSLADKSHRPHSHPNQHTLSEIKLILSMRYHNPNMGIVVFWIKLRQKGYTRSVSGLYRFLRKRNAMAIKLPNPKKYVPKAYEQMTYPGQRAQVDVKVVPKNCILNQMNNVKWYQYTFIDEYSRFRYLEAFTEQSPYASALFIQHVVKKFPYKIECIQTDNGSEFTNRLSKVRNNSTIFEEELNRLKIEHKLIYPCSPQHNGKVERSHRKDNEEFYAARKFSSFNDFKTQLAIREVAYNNFPMKPLNWHSPKQTLNDFR